MLTIIVFSPVRWKIVSVEGMKAEVWDMLPAQEYRLSG